MKKKEKALDEEKSSTGGEIDRSKKGVTKHKENPNRFSDEEHTEPKSQAKSKSSAEKAGDKAHDKAQEKDSKAWGKANPGKQTIMKGGVKTTNETAVPMNPDGATAPPKKNPKTGRYPVITSGPNKGKEWSAAAPGPTNPAMKEAAKSKKGDGNLANNAKPYDKVTQGDVVAGRLGKDEKGGKAVKETAVSGAPQKSGIAATATTTVPGMKATQQDLKKAGASAALGEGKCNHTPKGKSCPVHGLKECGGMYEGDKFDPLKHVKNPTKGEKTAAKDVKRGSYADRAAMLKSAEKDGRLKG
jgi:hypothetical protein